MDSLLTDEQRERLRKLDEEMESRKKNQTKREETSKKMGIPIDVVDMDVIKIGIMLGLIKKRSATGTSDGSPGSPLLDLILGETPNEIDTSLVPKYYNCSPKTVSETSKIQHQQNHVQKQTDFFSQLTTNNIKLSIEKIRKHVYFNIESWTIDNFKNGCLDVMDAIIDNIIDEDGDDEEWESLKVVRNCLFGFTNICEYRQLLKDQILKLSTNKQPHRKIIETLSLLDRRLSLYSNSLTCSKETFKEEDASRLVLELKVRSYTKNPCLKCFNFNEFIQDCCTPALLCVPVDVVLNINLIGPYMNNSIGFLASSTNQHHTFYVLDQILSNGVRLWVMDIDLIQFCESLIKEFVMYLVKIFRTFYKACFSTNRYISGYISAETHGDVFTTILKSLQFLCEKQSFHQFIKRLVISKSCIIPTEYDYFNYIESYQQPQAVYFEKFDKLLYDTITEELFDT
jgi:hypothetical protein